jgi:serine/threonine protein phosphatase PrpC
MIRIFSAQGKNTPDNRDVVIHFYHFDFTVFVVIDGATNCPLGGDFSRELAFQIEQKFKSLSELELLNTVIKNTLINLLKNTQGELQKIFISDFSSILVALKKGNDLLVFHSGDCCVGFLMNKQHIRWVTPIHTAANVFEC